MTRSVRVRQEGKPRPLGSPRRGAPRRGAQRTRGGGKRRPRGSPRRGAPRRGAQRTRGGGFFPFRSRGQSFLADRRIARRLVEAVGPTQGDVVLEVGPGFGSLTRLLLDHPVRVVAVEKDRYLAAYIRSELGSSPGLIVVEDDILELDWTQLPLGPRAKLLTNLPFSITSPFLLKLFASGVHFDRAVVTVQREVAMRLVAAVRTRSYGRLTVVMRLWGEARRLWDIGPGAFRPTPKVVSTVLELVHRPGPTDFRRWRGSACEAVVRAAFGGRRKRLANALAGGLALERPAVAQALADLGIDPGRRAEELAPDEYLAIAHRLAPSIARKQA